MNDLLTLLLLAFWGWMAVDCLRNPKGSMSGGGWSAAVIFLPIIGALAYFFVHYLPRFTAKGRQEWLDAYQEAEIQKRKEQAKKKGITRRAILIAKQLGDRDRDGWHVYKDSELRIAADRDSVGVSRVSDAAVVFKAGYSDTPVYEYNSGTSLERRDDGGYDVVHETGLGGGFTEEVLGYVPGEWEGHLRMLSKKAKAKRESDYLERRKMKNDEDRKSFGL